MEGATAATAAAVSHDTMSSPGSHVKPTCQYVDLLAERRQSSDLRWAIREWKSVGDYKYGNQLKRKEIFHRVLHSDRVQHTISQVTFYCLYWDKVMIIINVN